MITEIGAVKVRGGEVLGEFQTLVNPHTAIPPFIAVLTGITNSMVADAPPIESALPAFLEFAAGSRAGRPQRAVRRRLPPALRARSRAGPGPRFEVLDTARLARRVITRDDAPNCKLSSLARLFNAATTPNHRALSDARATVDVLHGLMERLGGLGRAHARGAADVLLAGQHRPAAQAPPRRAPPPLPRRLPLPRRRAPGSSTSAPREDLRTRVRSYFTASETRSRMGEMVGLAASVTGIECATPLEAEVRELRLIAEHKPRYNRRSRFPEKVHFIKLTREPWPRLSLVRRVLDDDADYLGPFSLAQDRRAVPGRAARDLPGAAVLRPAGPRAVAGGLRAGRDGPLPLALRRQRRHVDVRRGGAPAARLAAAPTRRGGRGHQRADGRRSPADERFEEAGVHRDRLAAFVRAAARTQRLSALTRCPEVVAARREDDGRWAVHVVRFGRLAAAGVIPPGADAAPVRRRAAASRRDRRWPRPGPVPAATAEETEKVLRWLESPGIRLVDVDGEWTCPVAGATRHLALHDAVNQSRLCLVPFDDRRTSRRCTSPLADRARVGPEIGPKPRRRLNYRQNMAQVSVVRRLARDLSLGLFLASVFVALFWHSMAGQHGVGWDAHAYYVAWSGGLYEELPETLDAYNYSPLFAQVIWPLTLLPWPVFCALFVGAAAAGIVWLSRPLPTPLAIGLWLFCLPEILSGNIFWLLAVMTVVGFSRGSPWCVAAFTKVVPCLGPVWFLARREWRLLAGFVATFVCCLLVVRARPRFVAPLVGLPARERRRVIRHGLHDPGDPRHPAGPEAAGGPAVPSSPAAPTGRAGWSRSRRPAR